MQKIMIGDARRTATTDTDLRKNETESDKSDFFKWSSIGHLWIERLKPLLENIYGGCGAFVKSQKEASPKCLYSG